MDSNYSAHLYKCVISKQIGYKGNIYLEWDFALLYTFTTEGADSTVALWKLKETVEVF
jgi:hypothetical protein